MEITFKSKKRDIYDVYYVHFCKSDCKYDFLNETNNSDVTSPFITR